MMPSTPRSSSVRDLLRIVDRPRDDLAGRARAPPSGSPRSGRRSRATRSRRPRPSPSSAPSRVGVLEARGPDAKAGTAWAAAPRPIRPMLSKNVRGALRYTVGISGASFCTTCERAPVEGLDRRARRHARLADRRRRARRANASGGERLRRARAAEILVSMLKRTRSLPALLHEREQVGEPRDARAVDRLLLREALRVVRPRLDPPHVVARELLVRERVDRRPARLEPPSVGAARDVGIERGSWWITTTPSRVTPTSSSSVVDAERRAPPRKAGSVFSGASAARAAVALEVEGRRAAVERERRPGGGERGA